MTRYAVRHETLYTYHSPVDIGLHLLRLTPLNVSGQFSLDQALTIEPQPAKLRMFTDHFGNVVHHVAVEQTHGQFSVTLNAEVEVTRAPASGHGPAWEAVRESMRANGFPGLPEVAEFVYASPLAAAQEDAVEYARDSFQPSRPIITAVRELTTRICTDFTYTPNLTDVSTKVSEVIRLRQGVCQDFAHLMISGLRGLGLPARYVSGYVYSRPARDGSTRPGSDASHAWVSVWCGASHGWIEFDPTNDLLVENEHVVVAYGRDFSDVTPLRGVILGGGDHTLHVAVRMSQLNGAGTSSAARGSASTPLV